MIKVEAWSLEEAYVIASEKLGCSVTEIEYEIVQFPSKGFFGFGRKKAVLVAVKKSSIVKTSVAEPTSQTKEPESKVTKQKSVDAPLRTVSVSEAQIDLTQKEPQPTKKHGFYSVKNEFDDRFFRDERSISEICNEIENDINRLFNLSCFELNRITVEPFSSDTVLITFSGADSALLIGKEGYRYKALSYLLFNWINSKYNLLIRLEIAEFLKNQEDMIESYLVPLIEQIRKTRRGQTKVLDGVLIQIALKILREEFKDLYVGVKTNEDGSKYIIVNEFYAKPHAK